MRWHRGWPAVYRRCSPCRGTKAAIGGTAVVKPFNPVQLIKRQCPVYDRLATDRSLALLLSGYTGFAHPVETL